MDKKVVAEAVKKIRDKTDVKAKISIVLGSGLGGLIDEIIDPASIPYETIPHFPVSGVKGHKGEVFVGKLSGNDILAFAGRVHYYEGYTMQEICFSVRIMAELGVEVLIITNASGAVNETFSPGQIVALSDHINLMGDNPLRGTTQFQDMTEAYSGELKALAFEVAEGLGIHLKEGVYLVLNGPSYETPAEVRMARNLGADLVGMSTIPEVIMANSLGIKVLGLSLATNMAAGILGTPLSHEEVIETSNKAAEEFKALVKGIVKRL